MMFSAIANISVPLAEPLPFPPWNLELSALLFPARAVLSHYGTGFILAQLTGQPVVHYI